MYLPFFVSLENSDVLCIFLF